MEHANDSKIKLLILYEILSKYSDEEHPMNTDEIITVLAERGINVSRKILANDIEILNRFGFEVLSFKKKYYYYYVVNRPLETAEVVLLSDVVKASKLSAQQKMILIGKLSGELCSYEAEKISKNIISFDNGRRGSTTLIYNVDRIDRAITENKKITFQYFDWDMHHQKVLRKDGKRYTANPIVMVWNKDNYYLLCFNNNHDNIVTYRLDKMDTVQIEDEERQPHPEYELFNTEQYRTQVFSMCGGELQDVTLEFAHEMLSDVFDRFGDSVRISQKDDTYSVNIRVQTSRPFFAWIVGTQGKVRVTAPEQAVNDFAEFVNKIKEAY